MSDSRDREYEFEMSADRAEVAAILSSVVEGLHAGTVRVSDGEEAASVEVPEELDLEVELELEGDEVSLELELTWQADDEGAAVRRHEPTDEGATVSAAGQGAEAPTETGAGDATDDPEPLARFELFRDRAEEWRWRLRHRNGNVIATSGEGYTRKHNAVKGLRSVARNAPNADVTEASVD